MTHRHCFEALDRSMRDIMRESNGESSPKVFGGPVVVLGGYFCQILLVVPKGSRSDIVNAAIGSSYLWDHYEVLKLTNNMRLQAGDFESDVEKTKEFAELILQIGDGVVGGENDGEAMISFQYPFVST